MSIRAAKPKLKNYLTSVQLEEHGQRQENLHFELKDVKRKPVLGSPL